MERLEDFDTIFVRIMLGLIVADMLHAVFLPSVGASETIRIWDQMDGFHMWLFCLYVLFIIKYIHTLSVLRYHYKSITGSTNTLTNNDVHSAKRILANIGFLLSRIAFLISLYFLASKLFNLDKQGYYDLAITGAERWVFLFLVLGAYVIPNFLYLSVAENVTFRGFMRFLSRGRFLAPNTLNDVYLSWAAINILNIILVGLVFFSRFYMILSFEVFAFLFLALNTFFDWANNYNFFFGAKPLPERVAGNGNSENPVLGDT